ncbi:hypothetical protein BGZ63DRAFT_147593 [Mariannaea sp. PMI_226]|nr:hypothetical protein BGZ63DRAFT_147593 [Mariannaea sp. PMI_226]
MEVDISVQCSIFSRGGSSSLCVCLLQSAFQLLARRIWNLTGTALLELAPIGLRRLTGRPPNFEMAHSNAVRKEAARIAGTIPHVLVSMWLSNVHSSILFSLFGARRPLAASIKILLLGHWPLVIHPSSFRRYFVFVACLHNCQTAQVIGYMTVNSVTALFWGLPTN